MLVLVVVEMPLQCRRLPIDFINEWSALVSVSAVAVAAVFAVTAVSFSVLLLLLCVCVCAVVSCQLRQQQLSGFSYYIFDVSIDAEKRRKKKKRESGVKHHQHHQQQYLCRQLGTLSFGSILLLLPLLCLIIVDLLCVCLSQTFECLCPECA